LWVSVSRIGVFRVVDGEWVEYGNLDALPRAVAHVAVSDESGTVWLGYSNNRIARVNGGLVQIFDTRQGLGVGNVLAIFARGGQVWVGGELGFARLDGDRFVSIHGASELQFRGISGIVRARNGDFWLNGGDGVTHIARQEIERVVEDAGHRVQLETFNYLDGILGTAVQLRPQPSAIETTDGRIWFSMTAGIVSIDALHLVRNTLAPPVTIWSLTSGTVRYPKLGTELHLPVRSTDVQIEYSAGSLTVPERVHFRYRLEGSDRDWQEAGARREANYTNLGPGHYTFRVIASNNDGVWNNTGASINFTIAPAFYQTNWFYGACGLVCVAILAGLYRVRMRQVAAQVRGRLEARLAERERIARDLHDTLLQGMQGLIWRFQAAADRLPPDEPARQVLEQSLDRADQLLAESRDKVKDLRPAAPGVADLARALAAEGEQFAQLHAARFRMSVQGHCRDLHPIVREEGFLIGREALANAFRHAGAADIEAEVTYDNRALHVRIRDDGQGIGMAVLNSGGRPGHFGLIGMRERAKKLGANLEVWSKPGAGTEVDLQVAAEVAYKRPRKGLRGIPIVGARP
jgi:signal transduction histidine kinase